MCFLGILIVSIMLFFVCLFLFGFYLGGQSCVSLMGPPCMFSAFLSVPFVLCGSSFSSARHGMSAWSCVASGSCCIRGPFSFLSSSGGMSVPFRLSLCFARLFSGAMICLLLRLSSSPPSGILQNRSRNFLLPPLLSFLCCLFVVFFVFLLAFNSSCFGFFPRWPRPWFGWSFVGCPSSVACCCLVSRLRSSP